MTDKNNRLYAEELIRLVDEFKQKIKSGISDSESFMTITEIERLWSELRGNTSLLYSDMLSSLLCEANEKELIRKKKREYKNKGIVLRTNKKYSRSILTLNGKVDFSRYVLRPKTAEDKHSLAENENRSAVIPLDEYLGISKLPFKMTALTMLEAAFWAQNQISYQAAEEMIKKTRNININDDTVRLVTNTIGSTIFNIDCACAQSAYDKLMNCRLSFPENKKKGILYIEVDGAALNTRIRDVNGSTWRENKLGVIFSSDNIRFWNNKKGERQHAIQKREYISYVGTVEEFKKHLFSCALKNGYGIYEKTVMISDGASWIRNIKRELFPDAQQILDYYHLCENVNTYAKQLYDMNDPERKLWSENVCELLREGKPQNAIDEIKKSGKLNGAFNLIGYIENNLENIDYAAYKKNGYFIGSGAIESGNKIVLQKRLKQAGMRWNSKTAQYLLTLISKKESGLWEDEVVKPILKIYGDA